MPKGKTPSLIGSSLGRPAKKVSGKRCSCSRCRGDIIKNEACFDIPQPQKPHSSTRRFCLECFTNVLQKTRDDLEEMEKWNP